MTQSLMVYTEEAGKLTGKHPKTLINLAKAGKFPRSIKIGNQHAWPRQVILEFLGLAQPTGSQGTSK